MCLCLTVQQEYLLSRNIEEINRGRLMTMTQCIDDKDAEISRVIDRVLQQVFGKEATQLIYKYLEAKHSLKQDEISQKIDLFAKGLEDFLNSGAYVVEQKILQNIYSNYGLLRRLQLERNQVERCFVDQVRLLKQRA